MAKPKAWGLSKPKPRPKPPAEPTVSTIPIESIETDADNARRRDANGEAAIKASLERFGAARSVVIDGDNVIRAGNGTAAEAKKLGFKRVIVVEPAADELVAVKRGDWNDEEARGYSVADNKATDLSFFDDSALAKILKSVPSVDPAAMGFGEKELVSFLAKVGGKKKEPGPPPKLPSMDELAGRLTLHTGDCLDVLAELDDASIDALVTDPPAGISFMGKQWDRDKGGREKWVEWLRTVFTEALRVLKPGGHALVWSIPRTSHWTGTAIELAGFEIRDCVAHLFGTGFPKSLDLGDGVGTGLKPGIELWWLARKPLEGTVAANLEKYGTGGLNIDGCRVGSESPHNPSASNNEPGSFLGSMGAGGRPATGRWPANVAVSHSPECGEKCAEGCAVAELDEQSGESTSTAAAHDKPRPNYQNKVYGNGMGGTVSRENQHSDSGGASRFFYCPKPSTAERDEGLGHLPMKPGHELSNRKEGSAGSKHARASTVAARRNPHSTVKSIELMRWLIRLVTPPGGLVMDPFMGSGSTGCAALIEGFRFIGIEQDPEYSEVARARILAWAAKEIEEGIS